jgi:hypothetical protein
MRAEQPEDIVWTNFGAGASAQLDLFFVANHSMDPGCGIRDKRGLTALLVAKIGQRQSPAQCATEEVLHAERVRPEPALDVLPCDRRRDRKAGPRMRRESTDRCPACRDRPLWRVVPRENRLLPILISAAEGGWQQVTTVTLIYEAQFQRLSRRRNRASSLQPLRPIPKKQYPYPLRFGPGNSLKALFQSARTARIHSPRSGCSAAV